MKKIWSFVYKRLEGIGLLFLLISFGWQCFEDDSSITRFETYFYDINDKIDNIWRSELNNYVYSDRNKDMNENFISGNYFNYKYTDANWQDWQKMRASLSLVNQQEKTAKTIRIIFYILGSFLVLYPKLSNPES